MPERGDNIDQRLALLVQNATALGVAGHLKQAREALSSYLELAPKDPSPSRVRAAVLATILDEIVGRAEVGRDLLLSELSRLPDRTSPEAAELMREIAFTCFLDVDWAGAGIGPAGHWRLSARESFEWERSACSRSATSASERRIV